MKLGKYLYPLSSMFQYTYNIYDKSQTEAQKENKQFPLNPFSFNNDIPHNYLFKV